MDVIKDFEDAGTTVGDILTIDASSTAFGTDTAGATATILSTDITQAAGALDLTGLDTDAFDILEIQEGDAGNLGALADDFDGTQGSAELLKFLVHLMVLLHQ